MKQRFVDAEGKRVGERLSVSVRHADDQMATHGLVGSRYSKTVEARPGDGSLGEKQSSEINLRVLKKGGGELVELINKI